MRYVIGLLAAVLFIAVLIAFAPQLHGRAETPAGVKIMVNGGHGSGVHIGRYLVLTAAHVVENNKVVRLKTEAGEETSGEVLWLNTEYDIALVQAYDLHGVRAAPLACADINVGAEVQTTGNPGPLEFVRMWGTVASTPAARKPWKRAYVVDLTVARGVSGAPLYDREARLRGIIVGMAMQPGMIDFAPIMLTYVVPTSIVCTLLGRV